MFLVSDLISSVKCNYCMDPKIPFAHCSQKIVLAVQVIILHEIHPACHNDTKGIKPGSHTKMTDKHDAEYSKNASLGVH